MEFAVLGWPPDGPTLSLDHERFGYAGKFVMSDTGKAVTRAPGDHGEPTILAAVAFSPDRTDPDRLRLRYVTVRRDRRGEAIGSRLLRFTASRARERDYAVDIAVNNPFAFEAASRAGFRFTGEETGIAERRMRYAPTERDPDSYQEGFASFRSQELPSEAAEFVADRLGTAPPELVAIPDF